ncbi:MAG TPA: hypothetical protein PL009_13730 [Flavipsychrobacter sp.]|nr:hypothetical protein [Flavipsychrobacter sp.]
MKCFTHIALISFLLSLPILGCAQQQVDNDYKPEVDKPLYATGKGPLLLIDGGHQNFHILQDKFAPFGKVATASGFQVKSSSAAIMSEQLKDVKVLVIANALNERNRDTWQQPVYPAFTAEETATINAWVKNGGRLFLIADHMPFAGAAATLARSFGFEFYDGFAMRKPRRKFDAFAYSEGTLSHNEITDMHSEVDTIITFTGQAFKIPTGATSIITLDSFYTVLMPEVAWEFNDTMKMIPAKGLSQLAYHRYGSGKIVVSGEAAMFTAQKAGNSSIGLNAPVAKNNLQLLLNILEWLVK